MRKLKSTLRLMRATARSIAEEANVLDRQSKRLHRLAERVNEAEIAESALSAMMVSCEEPERKEGTEWGCPIHEKFVGGCEHCHTAWMNAGIINKVNEKGRQL